MGIKHAAITVFLVDDVSFCLLPASVTDEMMFFSVCCQHLSLVPLLIPLQGMAWLVWCGGMHV